MNREALAPRIGALPWCCEVVGNCFWLLVAPFGALR